MVNTFTEYTNMIDRRTADQREIDYVETESGSVKAWEMKWNPKAKIQTVSSFEETYGTTLN